MPPASNCRIMGLTLCVVYSAEEDLNDTLSFGDIVIKNRTKNLEWPISPNTCIPVTRKDHMWFIHIPHAALEEQLEDGNEVEVSVTFDCSVSRVKCGIQLIYEQIVSSLNSEELSLTPYASYENADAAFAGNVDGGDHALTGKGGPVLSKRSGYYGEQRSSSSCSGDHDPIPKRLRIEHNKWKQNENISHSFLL